jgi:hypothetical protein
MGETTTRLRKVTSRMVKGVKSCGVWLVMNPPGRENRFPAHPPWRYGPEKAPALAWQTLEHPFSTELPYFSGTSWTALLRFVALKKPGRTSP